MIYGTWVKHSFEHFRLFFESFLGKMTPELKIICVEPYIIAHFNDNKLYHVILSKLCYFVSPFCFDKRLEGLKTQNCDFFHVRRLIQADMSNKITQL